MPLQFSSAMVAQTSAVGLTSPMHGPYPSVPPMQVCCPPWQTPTFSVPAAPV
ncbi:MAG: hypothetical protein QM820_54100 [Minicystis sp.]